MTQLAAEIELATGRTIRFGPDEADVGRVPTSISLSTELPGGFGPADIVLPRPDRFDPIEAQLWAATRIYEAESNRTLYEGRIVGTPAVGADAITLECEGFAKSLEDDKTARFLGVDRDLSAWESASTQRQLNLAATPDQGNSTVDADDTTGAPALMLSLESPWVANARSEAWYDAQGERIGFIDYAWKNSGLNPADPAYFYHVFASTDDVATSSDATADLHAAGPGSGTLTATGGDKRFGLVMFGYASAVAAAVNFTAVAWTLLGVIGTHGLPLQGSVAAPNTGRGLLVSDMLAYLVRRFAPSLNVSTGTGGSIEPTSFAVPHMVFKEATTAKAMVESMVLLGGNTNQPLDWGVYEDREFFAKSPGTYGTVWRARLDQASESTDLGPDASTRINGVLVTYDDGTGSQHSVGPTGSGAETTNDLLLDTDPDNPANIRGERHWETFDAGITSAAGALLIGQLILYERNQNPWRGDVVVRDTIRDSAGNVHPVAAVRAGDRIVVEDDTDTSERRIVGTDYDNGECRISVGNPPNRLDSLLANLADDAYNPVAPRSTGTAQSSRPHQLGSPSGDGGGW